MKRILLAGGVAVALTIPGIALAEDSPTSKESASAACRTELAATGKTAFRLAWGTNHNRANAMGKCVSKRADTESANRSSASSTCKTQRDDPSWLSSDGQTFADEYGTNKNKSNAFGKCVSRTAKALSTQQTEDRVSASDTCKAQKADAAWRSADGQTFADEYGTNANKRNAFGKCVSRTAKALAEARQAEQS